MPLGGHPPGGGAVPERQAAGLVVIFEDIVVPLQQVQDPEAALLARKLDGAAHFGAGIAPGYGGRPAAHALDRRRSPQGGEQRAGFGGQAQVLAPDVEVLRGL